MMKGGDPYGLAKILDHLNIKMMGRNANWCGNTLPEPTARKTSKFILNERRQKRK